jgi:hypothetical protein
MFYGLHTIFVGVVSCSNKGIGGSWTCVGLTITMVLIDEDAMWGCQKKRTKHEHS